MSCREQKNKRKIEEKLVLALKEHKYHRDEIETLLTVILEQMYVCRSGPSTVLANNVRVLRFYPLDALFISQNWCSRNS